MERVLRSLLIFVVALVKGFAFLLMALAVVDVMLSINRTDWVDFYHAVTAFLLGGVALVALQDLEKDIEEKCR